MTHNSLHKAASVGFFFFSAGCCGQGFSGHPVQLKRDNGLKMEQLDSAQGHDHKKKNKHDLGISQPPMFRSRSSHTRSLIYERWITFLIIPLERRKAFTKQINSDIVMNDFDSIHLRFLQPKPTYDECLPSVTFFRLTAFSPHLSLLWKALKIQPVTFEGTTHARSCVVSCLCLRQTTASHEDSGICSTQDGAR